VCSGSDNLVIGFKRLNDHGFINLDRVRVQGMFEAARGVRGLPIGKPTLQRLGLSMAEKAVILDCAVDHGGRTIGV